MKYSVIGYLIGEGFRNVLKNKKSTAASLIIMCATMLIFGIFFIIGENVQYMIANIEGAQGIEVFIQTDATEEQVKEIGDKLKNIEYVNTIKFVDKDEAIERLKKRFKEKEYLAEVYRDANILPVSYIITLTDLTKSDEIQNQIKTWDHIKNITSSDETISALIKIASGIRIATAVILVILILISVFIISNTIKLTVHARRKEISIMKYVGATNGFIRWPFIVEGIIIGLLSALLSVLMVGGAYSIISDKIIQSSIMTKLDMGLVGFSEMFIMIIVVYMVLGIGIGIIGSIISMRKYLKV